MFFNFRARTPGSRARHRISVALVVVVCGITFFYLARWLSARGVVRAQGTITPFVLQMQASTLQSNGKAELFSKRTEARRSDGATALVTTILGRVGLQAGKTARKLTLMDGRVITLDDSLSAKTTWPRRPLNQVARVRQFLSNPPEDCIFLPGDTLVRHDSVLGQKAAVVRESPLADGSNTYLRKWRAPALACVTLRYDVVVAGPNGSEKLLTQGRAVSLKLGEPPSALFNEGETYTEMSPSEMVYAEANRLGLPTAGLEEWSQRADSIYAGIPVTGSPQPGP